MSFAFSPRYFVNKTSGKLTSGLISTLIKKKIVKKYKNVDRNGKRFPGRMGRYCITILSLKATIDHCVQKKKNRSEQNLMIILGFIIIHLFFFL